MNQSKSSNFDTPTILIVDDTPSNLSVVVNLFEEHGYRVAIAQDGDEGLQRAQLVLPDLILLDVMMPGIDGFEVCRRLKAQDSTRDIPVIFMTALASSEHKVRGFQVGAVDYVTKPLQIDEVMARVGTHLKLSAAQKTLAEHNEELERRVAERTEELAAREREFRTLVENAPDVIARYDRQCRYFYTNPQYEKTTGLPARDILGKTTIELFPGNQSAADYQALMTKVIETGQPGEYAVILPDDGSGPGYHNVRLVAERDENDQITGVLAIGRDVTAMKRAERELHLLNRALDNSFDATYLLDTDLRIRYVNEAAVRELGYSREELLSMNLLDIDPNVTREMVQGWMAQTMTAGRFPGITESQHQRKSGELFPIEIGASTFNHEGEHLFLTVVRNIAERKETEQRLHAKEQAIRAVVENSPDTVIRYDKQCRRIYLNPAMEKIFGQPREQLHGTSPSESSILPALYLTTIKKTLETGREQRMESSFRNLEGETRWVDLRFAPEFGADGEVATVLAIGRDITERKHVESALRESEQRYREIFENVTDSLYLVEVTPEGRFRNLAFNAAFEKSTGLSREILIGCDAGGVKEGGAEDSVVTEETARSVLAKYRHCVEAGVPIEEDSVLDLPSGVRHYHSTLVPLRDESGRIYRILGVAHDVTEIKHAERELEKSRAQLRGLTARREKAREDERKYIAREVHDELGQILTGLQLNVSVLTHKFAADSAPLREQLQETRVLTDRALAVARNVASALRPAALDMGIVSALEWLVGRFKTNTGIYCEVHAEDMDIQLDESHAIALFRIVQESLTNAARHAKADRIDIDFGMIGDDYSLKVRDNGAGFDEKTTKADSFGLVGMRERALLLGGEVLINSKPGEGTEIEVRIPAHNVSGLS